MIVFYLLITAMPLSRHPIWSRFMGELTVIKYLGGACLLYALFRLCQKRSVPHFLATWQARWFTLLILVAMVSFFCKGRWSQWETSPLLSYVSFLLLFFLTLVVVDSVGRLRSTVFVTIGSAAVASLFIIREWQKYHAVYLGFRPGFVAGDSDYFTVSMLVVLPLALYFALHRRGWERLFCLAACLVILIAVTLAASRGGLLGLAAALTFTICHSRQQVRNLVVTAGLVIPLLMLAPSSPLRRVLDPSRSDHEAADIRKAVWKAGFRMIRDHPVTGVGLGNYKLLSLAYDPQEELPMARVAHNAYLEIGAELGLPALAAFIGILVSSYRCLGRVRRRAVHFGSIFLQQTAVGLQAGLIGYAVTIFFASGQYQKLAWLILFLSMCMSTLAVRQRPQHTAAGAEPVEATARGC